MKAETDDVYILHSRPFRETSQLTDLLSANHGRFRVVHRGGKQKKIQPFNLATATWSGKSDLKTLRTIEPVGVAYSIQGMRLFAALYVNELLAKVLHEHDPCEALFEGYQQLLGHLAQPDDSVDVALRQFENLVLNELGYGHEYAIDAVTGEPIRKDQWYWFEPGQGFLPGVRQNSNAGRPNWVQGESLLAIIENNYQSAEVRLCAKKINQLAIAQLLGGKTLNSSDFFKQIKTG